MANFGAMYGYWGGGWQNFFGQHRLRGLTNLVTVDYASLEMRILHQMGIAVDFFDVDLDVFKRCLAETMFWAVKPSQEIKTTKAKWRAITSGSKHRKGLPRTVWQFLLEDL